MGKEILILGGLVDIILRVPGFLIAISVHEYSHALMAYKLGDDTAKREGRLTLEPWAHLDLIGSIMLLIFRFGWARPVPVNANMFRNPRKDMAKVALAGPVANFITAFVLQIVNVMLIRFNFSGGLMQNLPAMLQAAVLLNIGLGLFNLIPIPPLDGSRILSAYLPYKYMHVWYHLERYGFIYLLAALYLGFVNIVVGPIMVWYYNVITSIAYYISMLFFRI